MSLLVKGRPSGREIVKVTPASAGWRHVGFEAWRLAAGETLEWQDADRESCVVVLTGQARVVCDGLDSGVIGGRRSVFDGTPPHAVYVPNGPRIVITAASTCEIAIASAPGRRSLPARVIAPADMRTSVRGEGSNQRFVTDILPADQPADSLLVVEVITPSGHSSSYPPHKHDTDRLPEESFLEETYYHRLDPAQGFAFQRVYTDDRSLDESHAVEDHDVMMVPRGYHPVVVPHGYRSWYLNVMAGPKREWVFRNDPAHEWMLVPR